MIPCKRLEQNIKHMVEKRALSHDNTQILLQYSVVVLQVSYLTGRMLGHVVVTEFRSFETSAAYTYKNTRISLENSKIKCGIIFVQIRLYV